MASKRKQLAAPKQQHDITVYCRTCARQENQTVALFSSSEPDSSKLRTIIEKYFPIRVTEMDRLPLQLCLKCAETLAAFEELVEGALQAEVRLAELFDTAQDDVLTEALSHPADTASDSDDLPLSMAVPSKKNKGKTKKDRVLTENSEPVRSTKKTRNQKTLKSIEDRQQRPLESQLCLMCLKSVRNLEKHLLKHDPGEKVALQHCPLCGEAVSGAEGLAQHVYAHLTNHNTPLVAFNSVDGRFLCFACHDIVHGSHAFLLHVAQHIPRIATPPSVLHCVVCGKSVLRATLRRHLAAHVLAKRFQCPHCGHHYAQESGLARHMRATHEGVRRYKCPVCPAVLDSNTQLRAHQNMHADPRPFQCDACGRTFLSQKHLYHHRQYHHTERGLRVACDQCSRVFSSASVLRRHHRVVHLRLKEFQCDVCSAQLSTKQYLKEHLRTHTDDRNEVCLVCGKTFQMAGNLRQHMKTHLERTQVCDVCGRRFARRCQLLIHMGSHRGLTPPRCAVCGRAFVLKTDLLKHAKEHEQD